MFCRLSPRRASGERAAVQENVDATDGQHAIRRHAAGAIMTPSHEVSIIDSLPHKAK
jgi:hypothetical protein